MRLFFFFIVSTLIHALLFAFPSPYPTAGGGTAVPVRFIPGAALATGPPAFIPEQSALQRMRPAPVKKKPARRPVRQSTIKKPPAAVVPKPTTPTGTSNSDNKVHGPVAQAEEPPDRSPLRIDRSAMYLEELRDEPLNMPARSHTPVPDQDLGAGDIFDENTNQAANPYDTASFPAAQGSSPPDALSPAMGQVNDADADGGSPAGPTRESPIVGAQYARVKKPEYPRKARRMGWEGTTRLRVLVDQQGYSKRVQIDRSSGFESLDNAAVKAVKDWRFKPARSEAGAVESWVKVPVVFSLEDSGPY